MGKVITVINQKGGVGKTTTAHSLGIGLAKKKKKILMVDLDPQGNLSYALSNNESGENIYSILMNEKPIKENINHAEKFDYILSDGKLSLADSQLLNTGREYILKEALETVKNDYDFIIIDTPPSLGILTINSLSASDECIITSQADIFSLQGIGQLDQTIKAIQKYCNPKLKIAGILITRYNGRTILAKDMAKNLEQIAIQLGTQVFKTKIRECVAIKEAQAMRTDIFSYSNNNASKDYRDFIKEYLSKL